MLLSEIAKEVIKEMSWLAGLENFWLDKRGGWKAVNSHGWFAKHTSNIDYDTDLAYTWMFQRGWVKVIREGKDLYIQNRQWKPSKPEELTKEQKDALVEKALNDYPEKLEIKTDGGRTLDLYERLQSNTTRPAGI